MKSVYLDHCVLCNLSNDPNREWKEIGIGTVLSKAVDEKRAVIHTSATEVLELFLTAKTDITGNLLHSSPEEVRRLELRTKAASNLLAMIDAQRMEEAFEFVIVRDFLDILDHIAPGSVLTRLHFDTFAKYHIQVFLGCLGLLASYPMYRAPVGIESMKRKKITNELLHSRFMSDPDSFVDTVIECAKNYRTTTKDIWEEYDTRTFAEMQQEIVENKSKIKSFNNKTKALLQRHRQEIAQSYAGIELGDCLFGVFGDIFYILNTFNRDVIKDSWGVIMGNGSKAPNYYNPDGSVDFVAFAKAISTITRVFAREHIFSSRISTSVVLTELELCLGQQRLPTGGLTFDSQHAVMLTKANIFITQDRNFSVIAQRAAKLINESGIHNVQVVTNADELEKALK